MAVRAPPGGTGDEGRPVLEPVAAGELAGDDARGEDYTDSIDVSTKKSK